MSCLSAGADLFPFCEKLAADSSPLSVLNIWTDSELASKLGVPFLFSQFLALLFVSLSHLFLLR